MSKLTLGPLLLLCTLVMFQSIAGAEQIRNKSEPLNHPLFHYDVIIDVGHGGIDGGTSYGALLEKDINLQIASRLFLLLQEKEYRVGITRLHDYALSDDSPFTGIKSRHSRDLKQRALIAEGVKPKAFLSIHINFSPRSHIKGPVILYQNQAESYLLAQLLQQELNQLSDTSNDSRMAQKYFLLEHVTQPSLIAEVGYLSHPNERLKLQDPSYQQQMAVHFVQALDQFFTLYP